MGRRTRERWVDVVILGHEPARAQLGGVDGAPVEEGGAGDAHAARVRADGLLAGEDAEQRALRVVATA